MAEIIYKIQGLCNIFKTITITSNGVNYIYYDTGINGLRTDVPEVIEGYIDQNTVLFIIANDDDAGRYIQSSYANNENVLTTETRLLAAGDTVIWVCGKLYCAAGNCVRGLEFDTSVRAIKINYTDGTSVYLPSAESGYSAGTNIYISDENVIRALGYSYDSQNYNFIENNDLNSVEEGVTGASVDGNNTIASANNQKVSGAFNEADVNQAYILGGGTSNANRKNIFTVDKNGVGFFAVDMYAGGTYLTPENKLSDLHNVTDDDWAIIEN